MSITKTPIFEVFEDKKRRTLFTTNLAPGKKVNEESLVMQDGVEYRQWEPYSSKLASAILNKSPNVFIRKNDIILYLGSSSGTTVSHVSDMVGKDGFVYAVDLAPRMMREFILNLEGRKNVAAVLEDANRVDKLVEKVSGVDLVYQDIAQRNQVEIFLKNLDLFVKNQGYGILCVKARSIDVAKKPQQIFREVRTYLEQKAIVVDSRTLEPYQKDHMIFMIKKK